MKNELILYMGSQWLMIVDDTLVVGVSEEGVAELSDITSVNLPGESDTVTPDEICGELDTEEGPLNLYCPIDGKVIEVNAAVVENPSLIVEDPLGDGWLFKVEADNPDDLDELVNGERDDE